MSKNNNVVEVHGCIVCAKVFNILAVYTPNGRLVDCTVTSPSDHIVPDKRRPLVACDTHTAKEVESVHKRWQFMKAKDSEHEQEEK